MRASALLVLLVLTSPLVGCRDLSRFTTTRGDRYEGSVVSADFVRAGVDARTTFCMTIDTDHLQDAPGTISTSDGRFRATRLRPIPQIWHDPLSTIAFGEGRERNLLYVATPDPAFADGGDAADVMVVVSLMTSGEIETRLVRGAPNDDAPSTASATNLFAVFHLERREGPCSY